jgi:predicted RNA-binding Zn ribbon-like protein
MAQRKSHHKYSQFRFDAGSLALNFVATVRHRGSQPNDLLSGPDALQQWLQLAGLIKSSACLPSGEHEYACLLREAIYRTVRSLILGKMSNTDDIALINMAARHSVAVPQLNAESLCLEWETSNPVKSCLSVIARDAIMLIGDMDKHRLKICDCESCQMLFADMSPLNRRRWCAMSICGNRQKVAMHRQRKSLSS